MARVSIELGVPIQKTWHYCPVVWFFPQHRYERKVHREQLFARCSKRLRLPKVLKPENEWIRCNGAFKAIVPEAVFWKAQAEMNRRHHIPTDEEMLAPIRKLLRINRYLTVGMIESDPEAWSGHSYGRRFGNLKNVYDRVGYMPPRNLEYQDRRRAAAPWLASVVGVARTVIESVGAVTATQGATLTVDRSWSLSFSIICPSMMSDGQLRWPIRQLPSGPADVFVFVRMDASAHHPIDYVVAPRAAFEAWTQAFYEHDCPITRAYLFSSLAILRQLAICSRGADVP